MLRTVIEVVRCAWPAQLLVLRRRRARGASFLLISSASARALVQAKFQLTFTAGIFIAFLLFLYLHLVRRRCAMASRVLSLASLDVRHMG